jgi:hypothetical protein
MSGHALESFRGKWDSQQVQALAGTEELVAQKEPQSTGVPVQQTRNTARGRLFQHRVSELQSSVVNRSSRVSTPVMENRKFCEQSERPWVVPRSSSSEGSRVVYTSSRCQDEMNVEPTK